MVLSIRRRVGNVLSSENFTTVQHGQESVKFPDHVYTLMKRNECLPSPGMELRFCDFELTYVIENCTDTNRMFVPRSACIKYLFSCRGVSREANGQHGEEMSKYLNQRKELLKSWVSDMQAESKGAVLPNTVRYSPSTNRSWNPTKA